MIQIIIDPWKKMFSVPRGTLLLDTLRDADINIATPCGGKESCGKCKVRISHSSSQIDETERRWLSEEEIKKGFRLACQYRLDRDVTITVPPSIPVMIESIWKESRNLPRLGLRSHARIYTTPNISAYVGGDIIADMIDISVRRKAGTTLVVDLGTNGEIILAVKGNIWTYSAAAGPAFEGARISPGMRAALGAIDQMKIKKQRLSCHVINQAKAVGLCG